MGAHREVVDGGHPPAPATPARRERRIAELEAELKARR